MNNLLKKVLELYLKHKEVLNYLIFGGLATLLNIVLYTVFSITFGFEAANSWANVLNNCICILFAYTTNRFFVFASKTKGNEAVKEFVSFVSCRIGTLVLDVGIMYFGATIIGGMYIPTEFLPIWGTGMKILANIVVVVLNYILSKLIIFKRKK